MSTRTMSSEEARTRWRTLLDLASRKGVDVIIERHGEPTAVVIGYEDYLALRALGRDRATRERGEQMAEALRALATLGEGSRIADPAAWQREERRERPLPGRDSPC